MGISVNSQNNNEMWESNLLKRQAKIKVAVRYTLIHRIIWELSKTTDKIDLDNISSSLFSMIIKVSFVLLTTKDISLFLIKIIYEVIHSKKRKREISRVWEVVASKLFNNVLSVHQKWRSKYIVFNPLFLSFQIFNVGMNMTSSKL